MASLHTGADLCYILTAHEAALPLKSYSPELMVTPIYKASEFVKQQDDDVMVDDMVQAVVPLLDRLHVLVVGPGLGRQARVLAAVAQILQHAMTRNLFLVLDADALYLLTLPDYKNLIQNYKRIVLTPNAVEYQRLLDAHQDDRSKITAGLMVRKGRYDQVWQDNQLVYECQEPGGLKRSGGLGDILAGCIATLVAWHVILQQQEEGEPKEQEHSVALACWTACCIVKRATKRAFGQKRRSMTAPDVLEALGPTIMEMEGEELEC
jgi:ATP-dependent NAD(P)H-hydrate dehydratase